MVDETYVPPQLLPWPNIPKDVHWNEIIVIDVEYYGDDTGTWKTVRNLLTMHELIPKCLSAKLQQQLKHIYLLAAMKTSIPQTEQLKYIVQMLRPLEDGFWCYSAHFKRDVYVVLCISNVVL